ncbi:unnamed protein product, partial [marine sediment metagenome]
AAGTKENPYIIENWIIDGNGIGNCIEIRDSDKHFIIKNCTVYNSGSNNQHAGIKLGSLKFGNLVDNYCFNNEKGIRVGYGLASGEGVENCTIVNNNCSYNRNEGILVVESSNNTINNNFCSNNSIYGISIAGSSNNTIMNNTCLNNSVAGIWIWEYTRPTSSYNNLIMDNILKYNDYGIAISGDVYCYNNLIYQNLFIDNNAQSLDDGSNNYWDNETIGNYWNDYGGYDINDDGLGDSPYSISGSAGSKDYYPIWDDGKNYNPIRINASETGPNAQNWDWAAKGTWCTGSGTWSDPYLIKNLIIDGGGTGTCIDILNSDVYFIIQNCTLYNAGSHPDAGIKLENTNNGILITNNCSFNNAKGIFLLYSNNNTISGNIANKNDFGIRVANGNNNRILGNNVNNNNGFWG